MPEYQVGQTLVFDDEAALHQVFGPQGLRRQAIELETRTSIGARGSKVLVQGEAHDVRVTTQLLRELYDVLTRGYDLQPGDLENAIRIIKANPRASLKEIFLDQVPVPKGQRVISPKGLAQKAYLEAIRQNDVVLGVGPAGTGKTYLAIAAAVAALLNKEKKRLVLTRPAVEAGEKLGFLPGDLMEKVDPYLRPVYDALYDMLEFNKVRGFIERGVIEVAPLAFMRGRTLNESFIILDEAQNTTPEQMRMFLTRLGYASKVVITGDITQVDLPAGVMSGLRHAVSLLQDIEGIAICEFSKTDVVRHPLVQSIIEAYEHDDERRGRNVPRVAPPPKASAVAPGEPAASAVVESGGTVRKSAAGG